MRAPIVTDAAGSTRRRPSPSWCGSWRRMRCACWTCKTCISYDQVRLSRNQGCIGSKTLARNPEVHFLGSGISHVCEHKGCVGSKTCKVPGAGPLITRQLESCLQGLLTRLLRIKRLFKTPEMVTGLTPVQRRVQGERRWQRGARPCRIFLHTGRQQAAKSCAVSWPPSTGGA